jgi:hypothetical protein
MLLYLTFFALSLVALRLLTKKKSNLPRGPKGRFLIGNLLDLPPPGVQEWKHWLKHKDLYGWFLHGPLGLTLEAKP